MRFYLDNDADAACCSVLQRRGHEVWTTPQTGRWLAPDDDQAVYAADKHAVLVSHDREFARRQRRNTSVRMVLLRCEQPDGPDVLEHWLPLVEEPLERMHHVVIELRTDSYLVHAPRWE